MPNQKLLIIIAVILAGVIAGVYFARENQQAPLVPTSTLVEYRNAQYGFAVTLPEDWQGFTVSIDTWTGNTIADQLGETEYTHGPVVSLHNPKWTEETHYQDIPIMVFTLEQWSDLQADKFHIGAAPIGPSELGRNSKYVLALPARYNFAFPPGYEEVDQVLQGKPLSTFAPQP